MLTADGVGLKISLTVVYAVQDPIVATHQVSDYVQALYLTLQTVLREVVGAIKMDDLLDNRHLLSQQLLESCTASLAALGLQLISVNFKDVMLPGELKRLYTQVVQARQEGLAQLERARGETAALRNLTNAARLTQEHPTLLKLRFLQALEHSSGNTFFVGTMPTEPDERLETL